MTANELKSLIEEGNNNHLVDWIARRVNGLQGIQLY
jgi:hypothetical protein